ncbi:MAG: NAD-binding protein [Erysipelotrichaceae bacterium]|jgi:trk system potassium uptake protein TrkA|nr:TrkA family potassium uptake protein [Erysipelotrichaceae bacterium]MBQ1300314.1 NAD-binding protein [Erysipelotrichaceae bacterium]MBQ1303426.1 NAD-binding protein [Erysipelotrichaceae bacterium]MBQ2684740.1 NAD-binding protein [Erysipelotrichaceae bacterium]MBR2599728.1 NAD-binding protein [Erysipelotrichaceae bacterium]
MSNSNVNTIVVGAGRLGSNIAKKLSNNKNDVVLIDKRKDKIGNVVDFSGFVAVGDATDLGFLEENGVKDAKLVAFMTDDDNTNIFLADVCNEIYRTPEIYIRLKDSRKMKIVSSNVRCICPFDLSLIDFDEQWKR